MKKNKLAVVAIGGNALIPDAQNLSLENQYEMVRQIAVHIADMISLGWNVVLTHGNGPQVGFIMRRSELSQESVASVPMDYAGADIQGAVGFMFCKALRNEFQRQGITREPIALVTQTLVDRTDPAFANPSKPIGSWYSQEEAERLATENGWSIVEDSGRGWRRVVPSPEPVAIVEQNSINQLVKDGYLVVALGGGGIPVIKNENNELEGVEAVIDKDFSSSLLARELEADLLLLPTGVDQVALGFNTPDERWIETMSLAEARAYCAAGEFPKGSMEPKVTALADFVEYQGGRGIITSLPLMSKALTGTAGTQIIPD
ncbi:carbamate kinase [Pseudodesulfovibrio sp. JC047]|uniref:carbamate kinase n=1 Tax=Pseudodesulfovibrio sp. JC047 TaxID=2683199 RepID=UPI0013D04684|nr:carbamate kinase [Pseudodesulfovibrio sp. JC047]NDV18566.1 carbamate kinase [Pseudodesulfovibrio sp. JC047]